MNDLTKTIQYIVSRSAELKNKFTDETSASVEFACIFCQNEEEFKHFSDSIKSLGKVVEETKTGCTYLLDKPIDTSAGPLSFIKIRRPDPKRTERGDADFSTDYEAFKKKYQNNSKFELVKRNTFEMLRLSDSDFDVMTCFSSVPKSQELGIKL